MYKIRIRCEDLEFNNKKMKKLKFGDFITQMKRFELFNVFNGLSILRKTVGAPGKRFTTQTFELLLNREFTSDECLSVINYMKTIWVTFRTKASHPVEQMRYGDKEETAIITRHDFATGIESKIVNQPKKTLVKNNARYSVTIIWHN